MSWVAGVDGCRWGWLVVLLEHGDAEPAVQGVRVRLCKSFGDVLALRPRPEVTTVDIPIGLLDEPDAHLRVCDRLARHRLKPARFSSVFIPPTRPMLQATGYEEVRSHGLSKEGFAIMPKVREVDALLTVGLQETVCEIHPELAFWAMAGKPMLCSKKLPQGDQERRQALGQRLGNSSTAVRAAIDGALREYKRSQVAPDDLVDACAAAWVAMRIASHQASRLPPEPPVDARGLRMEMWY